MIRRPPPGGRLDAVSWVGWSNVSDRDIQGCFAGLGRSHGRRVDLEGNYSNITQEVNMAEYEVCNQQFDRCPGCGQYKGQYHNAECPCLEEERNDRDLRDGEDVEGTD